MDIKNKNKGQIMLLTVVILGSIFLGASTIGGLLTVYQVRQANDAAVAAQAVFAADAGIEWQAFCYFVGETEDVSCPAGSSSLENGAFFTSEAALNRSARKLTITAEGSAGLGSRKILRALESVFTFAGGSGGPPGDGEPAVPPGGNVTLFADRIGNGGVVDSGDGRIYCRDQNRSVCQAVYSSGAQVSLTGKSVLDCTARDPNGSCIAGSSYSLDHWFGDFCLGSTNNQCSFTINRDTRMFGMFKQYTGFNVGTLFVEATLDGKAWAGPVNFRINESGGTRDTPYSQLISFGDYTVTYVSGGPTGAVFDNITPAATQTLNTQGGGITFRLNFTSR